MSARAPSLARLAAIRGGAMVLAWCALAGVIGAFARVWPRRDVFNYLMPFWLGFGLLAAIPVIAWSSRLRWPALAATALLVACAADRMGPDLRARLAARAAPPPADLRLIQFNLFMGNVDPPRTAAWIRSQRPDVVVVEEAALAAAAIPRLLAADLPYRCGCFARRPCATMILSRRPFLGVLPLGRGDPDNHEGRSLVAVALRGPRGAFVVVGTHLDHPWPLDRQADDLAALGGLLDRVPRASAIVAGDFNMVPWAIHMARQDRAIGLPRLTRALPTWPVRALGWRTGPPLLPIDHVYAGPDWRAVRVATGPTLGSDHRPVVVDLRWVGPRAAG